MTTFYEAIRGDGLVKIKMRWQVKKVFRQGLQILRHRLVFTVGPEMPKDEAQCSILAFYEAVKGDYTIK